MKTYGLLALFTLFNLIIFTYVDLHIATASTPVDASEEIAPATEPAETTPDLTLHSYPADTAEVDWQTIETLPAEVIDHLEIIPASYTTEPLLVSVATCDSLRSAATEIFEREVTRTATPFHDSDLDLDGVDCRLSVLGQPTEARAFTTIIDAFQQEVEAQGWVEDSTFVAYGPTETTYAFNKGSDSGLLTVGWQPAPHTNCVFDQTTSVCHYQPELRLYTVTFNFTVSPAEMPSI